MPRLLAAFPAVAGLQQIVDRIGGGVDVYSALECFGVYSCSAAYSGTIFNSSGSPLHRATVCSATFSESVVLYFRHEDSLSE